MEGVLYTNKHKHYHILNSKLNQNNAIEMCDYSENTNSMLSGDYRMDKQFSRKSCMLLAKKIE
jgi:hypothetical protein